MCDELFLIKDASELQRPEGETYVAWCQRLKGTQVPPGNRPL
jgi:hypothetical protein